MKCPNCSAENSASARYCQGCALPLNPSDATPASRTATAAAPVQAIVRGSVFAGKYRILEELGRGGMGVVYKAEDIRLKRLVALKVLREETTLDPGAKARFLVEAQAAAALSHPHICTVHEIDEAEGISFIAMEYVEGRTLRSLIKKGPAPAVDEILKIFMAAVEGVEEAHKKGIVHRDIKSANIMTTDEGQVKIMDFGLAKLRGASPLTRKGTTVGTVAYMSPEQVRGEPVDERSDIWSLGVVAYELLFGGLPFQGDTEQVVIHSILTGDLPSASKKRPDAPAGLIRVVEKCLEKRLVDRYQSASELRSDLVRVCEGRSPRRRSPALSAKAMAWGMGTLSVLALVWLFRPPVMKWLGISALPEIKTLMILPFDVVGGTAADQIFSVGLVNDVASTLSELERYQKNLWVVPLSEVREKKIARPSQARKSFDVTLVIAVETRKSGHGFELLFNLVDARTLHTLRSIKRALRPSGTTGQYNSLVRDVAKMLNIKLLPPTTNILDAARATTPGAYESYRQGSGYLEIYAAASDRQVLEIAISLLQKSIETDPRYSPAHAGLAQAYWNKYLASKEAAWIEKAKESCARAIQTDDRLAAGHMTLGIIHMEQGNYEAAIMELGKALAKEPMNFEACLQLGYAYQTITRFDKAEEHYRQAIRLKPYYWVGYSYLGFMFYASGRYGDAEEEFKRVIELNFDNYNGFNCLGGIYLAGGRLNEARAMFERSLSIKPEWPAYSNLGTIDFSLGHYPEATAAYEKAVQLAPRATQIVGNLARSYAYTPGCSEKSRAGYQQAVRLALAELQFNSRNIVVRSSLAAFYASLGDKKKALEEIAQARKEAPKDFFVLRKCVLVYELAGQRGQALDALRELVWNGGALEDLDTDPAVAGLLKEAGATKIPARQTEP
jgi:serine/threonine protein kinase/tetratricopeptide (TPR) repeat protein